MLSGSMLNFLEFKDPFFFFLSRTLGPKLIPKGDEQLLGWGLCGVFITQWCAPLHRRFNLTLESLS